MYHVIMYQSSNLSYMYKLSYSKIYAISILYGIDRSERRINAEEMWIYGKVGHIS